MAVEVTTAPDDRSQRRPSGRAPDIYVYESGRPGVWSGLGEALSDLWQGLALWRVWGTIGWNDFRRSTARTWLSPVFSLAGTALTVAILGYIYSSLLSMTEPDTYPYIAAGYILWFFISASVMGGFSVFISGASIIKEMSLPLSFSIYRYVFRTLVELCLKFLVFAGAVLLAGLPMTWTAWLALPGLFLFVLNGLWLGLLLGIVGARYRDIQQIVAPLMLLAFLATPVLWRGSMLQSNEFIATFNPFAHVLAVVREPLLGHTPALDSVIVVLAITVVGWLVAVAAFSRMKNRIVFWL